MTSKERVAATLEGRVPDRVPYAEFAVDFDTVERLLGHETYLRAKARSQIAFWEGRHDEVAQSWLEDHIALQRKLPLDVVTFPMATWELPPETGEPAPRRIDATTWEDREGRIYRLSEATQDITCVHDPVRDARVFTAAEFEGPEGEPARRDERSWKILDTVVQTFKAEKYICGPSGGSIGILLLGGMERGLLELAANPEAVRAATRALVRRQNAADYAARVRDRAEMQESDRPVRRERFAADSHDVERIGDYWKRSRPLVVYDHNFRQRTRRPYLDDRDVRPAATGLQPLDRDDYDLPHEIHGRRWVG